MDPNFGRVRRPAAVRRRDRPVAHPHGFGRAGEHGIAPAREAARRRSAPAGTSFLLLLVVGALTALGIVRVNASNEVLQLGAEITDLTAEQARLLDEKRRLEAERAYLRHPDHIQEVARDRLRMIPVAPVLVQSIRLVDDAPAPEESP